MMSTVSSGPDGGGSPACGASSIASRKLGASSAAPSSRMNQGAGSMPRHASRAGVLHDVARFLRAELGIARHHDRADTRAGEQQQRVPDVVARQHPDAVALCYAARRQQSGGLRRGRAELGPAPGLAGVEDERAAGIVARAALERAVERVVVLRIEPEHLQRTQHRNRTTIVFLAVLASWRCDSRHPLPRKPLA
jgi:hypothetical protein